MRHARPIGVALACMGLFCLANAQSGAPPDLMASQVRQEKPATLRLKLVREAAISAAMRASLAKQSETINKLLDSNARLLDDTYDFPALMLSTNVVPPVVRKIENVTEQEGDVLRYSAYQFQIVRQAQFATRAPTWRTYLPLPTWTDIGSTHPSLLPQNNAESEAAKIGIEQGWRAGIEQANAMFYKGLTRLQNDWLGMNTYHALLKSNMVSAPIVNRRDTPIRGNGISMTVDESTYRIEAKPVFNPNMSNWLALVDRSSASKIFEDISKPSDTELARASLAVPSMNELLKSWSAN